MLEEVVRPSARKELTPASSKGVADIVSRRVFKATSHPKYALLGNYGG